MSEIKSLKTESPDATTTEPEKKKKRKPRDPNAERKQRPVFALASVTSQSGEVPNDAKIVIEKFSKDAADVLIAQDTAIREGRRLHILTLTSD